jgi:DNA-binding SARP family transcriptional activator/ABC-type oligopeptide transport system substrate-binding subunit
MEFRILGPLEVRSNGQSLPLGGPKQRAVLALLLLGANRVVSRERLIAELWPDAPGRDSEHALTLQISRLRRALSAAGDGGERVVTRAPGYVLRVERDELDLDRYERLVAAGRTALEAGDAESAVARLRAAESVWRGRPLADLEFEPFARLDVERLEELRLAALEERIEAELATGRHHQLVPELEGLVAGHPLRERLRAQLMRALYASSRQAEALSVYTDTRRLLVDELGIEPSASLRELERKILNQDAGLLARQPAPPVPTAPDKPRESRRRPPRRRSLLLLGVSALGAALLGLIFLSGDSRPQPLRIAGPGAVLFLGTGSGDPLGQVSTGPGASRMRFGLGALWRLEDPGALLQIDPSTMRLKRMTPIGFAGDIAVAGNGVWVSGDTNTLVRVDPTYGKVAQRIRLPHRGLQHVRSNGGVAFGAGSVWVAQGRSRVLRVDPASERVQRVFEVPEAVVVAFGEGAVWVASSESGKLTKIDPRTNAIVASVRVGPSICCLAVGGGYVWTANDSGIWKISSDGRPIAVTELQREASEMSYGEGALWATAAGYVIRVDARSGRAKRWHIGYSLNGIAAAGGRVAVSVYVPKRPERSANLRGKILRVGRSAVWFDVTDPALAAVPGLRTWPVEQQLQDATCAGLVRYRPAPAPIRWRLVPEVAAALPAVSRGARTFTFQIRSGFRFSPPSNQRVTARTFKYTIERALSPNLGAQAEAMELASDIVGVRAYRARAAPHISGISARGQTLAITLTHAAADFPDRLTMAQFCPVPIGTPIAATGDHDEPIPSAGPYYLAVNAGGRLAVIRRNPYYHGARRGTLDGVVLREEVPFARTVADVEAGKADYVAEPGPALLPRSDVARRFGAPASAGRRYVRTPMPATDELVFNTAHGPLRNARLRRAINLALDRPALAAAFGDAATDRYLPPMLPGAHDGHVYPVGKPHLAQAQSLMHDRRPTLVLAVCGEPSCDHAGQLIARDLRRLRIDVKEVRYTGDIAARTRRARTDIVLARVFARYPDPLAFMSRALGPRAPARQLLDRLDRGHRLAAAGQLEMKRLRDDPPAAAFGTPTVPEFFSARVGCKRWTALASAVDLTALCLK